MPHADYNVLKLPGKAGDAFEDDFALLADIWWPASGRPAGMRLSWLASFLAVASRSMALGQLV